MTSSFEASGRPVKLRERPCPSCGELVPTIQRVCVYCSANIPREAEASKQCAQCGSPTPIGAAFCSTCGDRVPSQSQASAPSVCPRCGALWLGSGRCRRCGAEAETVTGTDLSDHRNWVRSSARSGQAAGFWARLGAFLIDFIAVAVVTGMLFVLIGRSDTTELVMVVLIAAYYVTFWSFGTSLGKMALGIRIVRLDTGGPPGFGRALARYVISLLSAFVLFLGYLWMLWDGERRTWHDRAASVAVIYH